MTGLEKLQQAVEKDKITSLGWHDYDAKLLWIIERAKQYAELLGITYEQVIDAWESKRDYWYMNYYQDCEQPDLSKTNVYILESKTQLDEISKDGFRCPCCNGISTKHNVCDSGVLIKRGRKNIPCDWKSYGLFQTLGKGLYILSKKNFNIYQIFMPISLENQYPNGGRK